MLQFNAKLFILISTMSLIGCGSLSKHQVAQPTSALAISSQSDPLTKQLYAHFQEWRGVQHSDGGNDKSGIDCSGFVVVTFRELFNQSVPRFTAALVSEGEHITKSQLRPGDLVFFKTGFKQRHVGIYLDQQTFMHVSSSRGVMLSGLNNPYWQETFWQARRLLPE